MANPKYVNLSLTIPEIFEKVGKLENNEQKSEMLRSYDTKQMRWFVDSLYNTDWSAVEVPEDIRFNNRPPEICNMSILNAITRINIARNWASDKPAVTKKNLHLVFEELSRPEADLIINMIKGNRKIEGVSKWVFRKVYPQFFLIEEIDETSETIKAD